MAEWKKEKVDCAKDIAKRKSIAAKIAPKLPSLDKNLVISDLPEVKEEFGNEVRVCWNCISEVCKPDNGWV